MVLKHTLQRIVLNTPWTSQHQWVQHAQRLTNIRDKLLLIDVNVRNPCGDTAITKLQVNTVACAAATKAVTDRAKTYTGTFSPVTSTLITAAFETFGR
jgi:hypothetical protein